MHFTLRISRHRAKAWANFLFALAIIYAFLTPLRPALADAPQWVGPATIERITVQPNGRIYVKLQTATPDLGCTGNTEGRLELNPSYPYFREQFSLLLAAHSANRTVKIWVEGCGYYPYAQNSRFL